MTDVVSLVIFASTAGAFFAGLWFERWRARLAWRRRKAAGGASVVPFARSEPAPKTDAADQLRQVMRARFEKRRLLTKSEARMFYAAEDAIEAQKLPWRAMAQVSLGEVLSSPDRAAFGAINSKRVDVLLISKSGEPMAAVEYQGAGHYQGSAPARDAVKKEALRRAGVGYIEMTPDHGPGDLAREIARIAQIAKASAPPGSKS